MSQTATCADEEYVRNWIAAFPLGEELQERGRQLREWLPLKVIMVTFGTGFNRDTNGIRDMRNMILYDPIVAANHSEQIHVASLSDKISLYTNRLDRIFASDYRQGRRGKDVEGQANFLRIYDRQMGQTKLYNVLFCIFIEVFLKNKYTCNHNKKLVYTFVKFNLRQFSNNNSRQIR